MPTKSLSTLSTARTRERMRTVGLEHMGIYGKGLGSLVFFPQQLMALVSRATIVVQRPTRPRGRGRLSQIWSRAPRPCRTPSQRQPLVVGLPLLQIMPFRYLNFAHFVQARARAEPEDQALAREVLAQGPGHPLPSPFQVGQVARPLDLASRNFLPCSLARRRPDAPSRGPLCAPTGPRPEGHGIPTAPIGPPGECPCCLGRWPWQ